MASNSTNVNPTENIEDSKAKEEGELSDSYDDANLDYSTAQSSGTIAPPTRPNVVPSAVKPILPNLSGNAIAGNNIASAADALSQQPIPPMNQKNVEKNPLLVKSTNRSWYAPSGVGNNLVIRFSDDDSGSDLEECSRQKPVENKSNSTWDGSQRPLTLSAQKINNLGQTSRNITRVIPKKPLSRTFTSSMTKTNGGANSKVLVSSVDQGSQVRYFNSRNKNVACQDLMPEQGVVSNSSKLQDLRQQIALRESELKLKAQHKETATMNLENSGGRKWIATSVYAGSIDPKEPQKKRLKAGDSNFTQSNSGAQPEVRYVKSNSVPKDQKMETNNFHFKDKVEQSKKVAPVSKAMPSVKWKKKDDKLVDISSDDTSKVVKDGVDLLKNLQQSKRSSRVVDPSVLANKTAALTNISATAMPNNSDTARLWNCLSNVNISGHSNVDVNIHSLIEIEENLDKELEEAQNHRRLCEIEEKNALKAYRKAQRALIEANARCTDLYRQRELCSARYRSLIVDNSCLLWSSRKHEHTGAGLDISDDVPENMNFVPTSNRLLPAYDSLHQPGNDANVQCINIAHHNMSLQHNNGQNLGSEPCSEQDASTSEPFPHNSNNAANGLRSPCSPIISADEGTSLMDRDSNQPGLDYQQKQQNSEVIEKNANNESSNQDSLLLEASLRSELFARLGVRTSSKNIDSCYNEPSIERGAENDVESEKTQMSNGSITHSEAEKKHQFDVSGPEKPNEVTPEAVENEDQHQEKNNILKFDSSANVAENGFSAGCHFSVSSSIFSPSILRSAIGHLKALSPISRQREDHVYGEEAAYVNIDEIKQSSQITNSLEEAIRDLSGKRMGSYMCDIAIDPSWPLCMYELRGKCNNDECPFQHVKELSKRDTYLNTNDDSDSADSQLVLASYQEQSNGPTTLARYHDVFISPTYIVSLDILKADPHGSVVPWGNAHCWWKYFSICLSLSSIFQKDLPTDESFLHGDDGRIEVYGSWNRQSSYFRSRNGIAKKLNQSFDTMIQSLEMALLILNQEVNKLEGMKKALSLLSRSLEADPASEILWMVYLLICYSRRLFVGKDDMFSFAVRSNGGSYELWLMYINSRKQLDDRLVAYEVAISALCRGASSCGKNVMHMSACILDLVLQMMDCLCMSGNVAKAIQTVYRLFPATANSDGPHCSMFSDILTCLTISDKCVLWVSCIYLVIYRKLPDAVVQRLELEKELLSVEWPSVHIGNDEKKRVLQLLEMVVSCVDSYINSGSFGSETDVKSAQVFALNHVKCLVALGSPDCSRSMFEKYRKVYPSCLELVLISARVPNYDSENMSFIRFEEALHNWPKESPGIHCIWNQYAEYAQQNGKPDLVKNVMTRWYNSVWKVQYPGSENLKAIDGGNSLVSPKTDSMLKSHVVLPSTNHTDIMFGYLNLFLYNFLQNDKVEAHSAIDQALRAATTLMSFNHCVKEHALFLLNDESQKSDVPISWQITTLNMYLEIARYFQVCEPLSRHFITVIEKPRVQQLVRNILSPVSSDSSLVNLVLEVWYGPSLLPQNLTQPKGLVDFVEAILALAPSNYELMFSVCKMLSRGDHGRDVSSSILFWASSTLVDAFFHAVPIPPELAWVNAADIMDNIPGMEAILARFYRKAVTAYPFSLKLWKCYYNLTSKIGDRNIVVEAARELGIELE
ncbi:uncharacterized protein LOC120193179 isoform X2 [Hibiscus syriacus]|uniref:uncharacterized protein LOC120193179 isoform X2 n=1 Tax=Hibiscus syriacus TaxID=106335 RepID=UPI001922F928|nr:uncharacterized protein LOC120193179 isoform X2 [Hibiscus syriacus]